MPRISTRALSGGLGSLAQAIAGGQGTFDQAAEQGAIGQSKIAQAIASIRASDATARLHGVQADDVQAGLDMQKPEVILRNAMTGFGVPQDEAPTVQNYLKTGQLGGKYQPLPADEQGPVLPSPDWAKNLGPLARQIMSVQNGLTLGDKNTLNVTKAAGEVENQGRIRQVIDGTLPASKFGQAIAASEGKPLVSGHEFGVVDNFTGAVDNQNPVATRFGTYRDSETGKNKAQAGAAYASAAHSNASTRKVNQEIEQGGKTGQVQLMTDNNGNIVGVNKATMQTTPAIGPDGKPLQGKGGNLNEGQANALTFANRMQASQDILDQMAKKGVFRGSLLKQGAEEVPLVGGALGMAANTVASPEQQQVEQAQRDFINAVLRRESGAAISMGEFSNAQKQYFDQPGDSRAVKDQKRASRQRVINGMLEAVPANMRSNLSKQAAPQGSWGPSATPSGATVSNW